ncbi:MAG: PilN domain-containing protein [bacterium]|nr:PilN domain-containing protein [bacterium]
MIEINLLPKNYLKKSYSFSLGKAGMVSIAAAAGIALMLIAVTFYQINQLSSLDENIEKARQRSAMLQKDIKIVDALTDVKDKITRRMEAVERLDSHRSSWVRILEEVARNVPEFVWVAEFEEQPIAAPPVDNKKGKAKNDKVDVVKVATPMPNVRKVTVEGYAFTLNALATYMINMMRSDYFDEVELVSSEEKYLDSEKKYRAFNFVLSANLHYLSEEQILGMVAQKDGNKSKNKSGASHKVLN